MTGLELFKSLSAKEAATVLIHWYYLNDINPIEDILEEHDCEDDWAEGLRKPFLKFLENFSQVGEVVSNWYILRTLNAVNLAHKICVLFFIFDELGKEVIEDIHLSEDTEDYHCVDAYFGCVTNTDYCIENLILSIFRADCEET